MNLKKRLVALERTHHKPVDVVAILTEARDRCARGEPPLSTPRTEEAVASLQLNPLGRILLAARERVGWN